MSVTGEGQLVQVPEPPALTTAELLTLRFYEWERRGRGWDVWPVPVELEPPFRRFFHDAPFFVACLDDARKPTLLSTLAERVNRWFTTGTRSTKTEPSEEAALVVDAESLDGGPEPFWDESPLTEFQVTVPPDLRISREATEQFLQSLGYASAPLAFELIGTAEAITVQAVARERDRMELASQLRAHFPEAVLTEEAGLLAQHWGAAGAGETTIVDFGLASEFMRPIRTFRTFEVDPLIGLTGSLEGLQQGEIGVLQVLFQSVRHPWSESILRAVTDWEGGPFFADAPEMVPLAREKAARPLFAAAVRIAARSPAHGRSWQIARALAGALRPYASPASNELIPLANDGYDPEAHEADLLLRSSRRTGMILNSEELVSLVHLPSASVRAEKLARRTRKTRAAPASATGGRLVLGENVHAGKTTPVTLSPEQRARHTYVIGASGTGKSTLLLNMIAQDIRSGEGVGVLDPHGDLIDQVLGHIPKERHKDVVLLDPSDADFPIGFNILQAHSELEKTLLASDLVAVFRRLSTSWGDQMTSVLGNAVLAFLESNLGGTLADLRRFLVEADFRRAFLETVQDQEVVYYWKKEFPLLAGKPQAPILTRLDTFLRPKPIRYMVSQRENRLDFVSIMNEGRIFLAKLAQGAIGEENASLLGALLVSKLHQMAMSRQETVESERRPFHFYIDEFHNFVTPSMAAILSGARKYRLGLVLAHQDLRQLARGDEAILGAVLSNPATRICFRVGDLDARKLEEGFSSFTAKDLQSLDTGEAICRIERADHDFNLKTAPLPAVEPALARDRRERVVALSRERYASRREVVEATLRAATPATEEPPAAVSGSSGRTVQRGPDPPPHAGPRAPSPDADLPDLPLLPRAAPPEPGRGGRQHKYLQSLIKRWAESRGWRGTIEKPILDGAGSVDVALEREGLAVAVEISVTTSPEHEVENIHKCIDAGFGHVLVISSERKTLSKVQALGAAELGKDLAARARFLTPEEVFSVLEDLEAQTAGSEETVRGYKVKVRRRPVQDTETTSKRRAVSEIILKALQRLKSRSN